MPLYTSGPTYDRNVSKQRKLQKICKRLSVLSVITAIWVAIVPAPYELAIYTNIIIPLMALLIARLYNKYCRIDTQLSLNTPTVYYIILLPSLGLTIRSIKEYDLLNYFMTLPYIFGFTILLLCILLIGNREYKFQPSTVYLNVILSYLFLLGYSYGTITSLNILLDNSIPQVFHPTILSKDFGSAKTSPKLMLSAWGPKTEENSITISRKRFRDSEEQEKVTLYYFTGRFKIPWYILE